MCICLVNNINGAYNRQFINNQTKSSSNGIENPNPTQLKHSLILKININSWGNIQCVLKIKSNKITMIEK